MKGIHTTKLKINDPVRVICGKDRGKEGKILNIDMRRKKVVVSGVNLVRKTIRKKKQDDKGGIVDIEHPLHISNLQIVSKGNRSRIQYVTTSENTKKRKAVKTGEIL